LILALVAVLVPGTARAFCRTTTVATASDFQPTPNKCWDQGVPLFWKNACVGYSLQRNASRQVAYEDAAAVATRAFTRWTGASCATEGAGGSRVSIDVRDMGPVDCGNVKYNQGFGNQNVIVFRDDAWRKDDTNNTLALTTVTFNPETGEIYDADMEVNTAGNRVEEFDPIPADGFDFASIMTHEAGHFLGLAHSGDPRATMFANYQQGNTSMRNLTQDDVAGICAIYRPDGTRAVLDGKVTLADPCDPTPRHGFARECAPTTTKGCSTHPGDAPKGASGAFAGLLVAAALVLRRARMARRKATP
jgi:MYXO-CTERM domain-containing protein